MSRKNWIAVASADHARRGCAEPLNGFMQVCHGKCAPLQRMSPGDLVAYYAPTQRMGGGDRLQAFVSLGVVQPGEPYAIDMGDGFKPFRRGVAYVAAQQASILPLLEQFDFVEDPQHWGYKFRFGLFDISDHDMRLIARAMGADLAALGLQARARPSAEPAARSAGAALPRQVSLGLQ
jgi:hypothetical protein